MLQKFLRNVAELQRAVVRAQKQNISLKEPAHGIITDYNAQKKEQERLAVITAVKAVVNAAKNLQDDRIQDIVSQLENTQDLGVLKQKTDEMLELGTAYSNGENIFAQAPTVPSEISEDVLADYNEMMKCFNNGLFRSAVVLCGRILETALHRKYFEVTGNDLLEKSPGIGLGSLVSKLSEKSVSVDPGLGNQIHLINQVRVHSVHHKKRAFVPSQQQARAIILYTLDVVEKLFA